MCTQKKHNNNTETNQNEWLKKQFFFLSIELLIYLALTKWFETILCSYHENTTTTMMIRVWIRCFAIGEMGLSCYRTLLWSLKMFKQHWYPFLELKLYIYYCRHVSSTHRMCICCERLCVLHRVESRDGATETSNAAALSYERAARVSAIEAKCQQYLLPCAITFMPHNVIFAVFLLVHKL